MNRPHPTRPPLPFLLTTLYLATLYLATLSCGDATRDPAAAANVMLTATTEHRYTVGALVGEEIPVIADMAVDREDRLWITRTGPGGDDTAGPTDVVAAGGEYIGTLPADGLRIPAAFGPGGLMAYIDADEMNVQTVRVIRLVSLGR